MKKILFFLLLASSFLSASDWTIYTWNYALSMYDTLQAVKFFVHNQGYLVYIIYLLSMIYSYKEALETGIDIDKVLVKKYVIAFLYIQFFLQPSNMTAVIEDEVNNEVYSVTDAPSGIVISLSLIFTVGQQLTELFESAYSTPSSLRLSEVGVGFTMSAHLSSTKAMPTDDNFLETFKYYYHNCLKTDIISRDKTTQVLKRSGDLYTDLVPVTALETLKFDSANPNGLEVSCGESWTHIQTLLPTQTSSYISNQLTSAMNLSNTKIEQGLEDMGTILYGSSKSGQKYIEQEMLRNLLKWGNLESAKITGGDVLISATAKAIADNTNSKNWQLQGEQAMRNLPMQQAVYAVLMTALMPLLAMLSAMTGQARFFNVSVGLLFSMALWTPIGTLMNFYYIGELERLGSTLAYAGDYISMGKSDVVSDRAHTMLAMLSLLFSMIPLFTMAIISGSSTALTRAFQGGTTGNIGNVGNEIAKGDMSYGNTSIGNTAAHGMRINSQEIHATDPNTGKETAHSNASGAMTGTSIQRNDSGNSYTQKSVGDGVNATYQSGDGVSISDTGQITGVSGNSFNSSVQKANQSSKTELEGTAQTESKQFSDVMSNNITQTASTGNSKNDVKAIEEAYGVDTKTAKTIESMKQDSLKDSLVDKMSTSEKEKVLTQAGVKFEAGVNTDDAFAGWIVSKAVGVSASASGNYTYTGQDEKEQSFNLENATAKEVSNSYAEKFSTSLNENESVKSSLAQSVTNSNKIEDSQAKGEARQWNNAVSEQTKYEEQRAVVDSSSVHSSQDVTNKVFEQYMGDTYGNKWENADNEQKAKMSMNEIDNIKKGDSETLNNIASAESTVYDRLYNQANINNDINSVPNRENIQIDKPDMNLSNTDAGSGIKTEFEEKSLLHNKINTGEDINAGKSKIENSTKHNTVMDDLGDKIDLINKNSIFNSKGMENSGRNLTKNLSSK